MDPDKYQQAWQAQTSQTRVTVDADLLQKEVQRNQLDFLAIIFRRDVIEVGVGLLLLPYWFYKGAASSLPWTWYLTVPAIIWVIGFILVDRRRYPQTPSEPGEPLLKSVTDSLNQVEHQIWLLRNVFLWYLMPFMVSILAFFTDVTWRASKDSMEALVAGSFLFAFVLGVYYFVDYINQRAVRTQLEPRRQELLTLLKSLGDETTSEGSMKSDENVGNSRILRRWLIVAAVCVVILVVIILAGQITGSRNDGTVRSSGPGSGITDSREVGPARSSGPGGELLATLITEQRKVKNLVGVAAMVMVDGQVEAVAAHGERKKGSGVPLEIGDRWHLGGITKSITATMIARLVEAGQMHWTDTIGEIFPEVSVDEKWRPVTLRQLLTDTAGAPANFPTEVLRQRPALGLECTQARRKAVLNVIAVQPVYPPGQKYAYTNVGYTIVGAMAEKVTGVTWEDLVNREVFEPLEITETGFGPPNSADKTLEQPRGHQKILARKFPVDDKTDNTCIMGPSGTVHMTLQNLCTFANEHLRGELGEGKILSTETFRLLHTPELDQYASGWLKKEPGTEGQPTMYWHNGSNTIWYALVVFIPEQKMVVAVTSNDGDTDQAKAAAWEIVQVSARQFNVLADPPRREPQQGEDHPK